MARLAIGCDNQRTGFHSAGHAMKIHQLPMGAHFEYEGEQYVKTGPLFATGRLGPRLIPKYATLKPLGDVVAPPEDKADIALRGHEVAAAFEAFCAECEPLVAEDRRPALAAARGRFLTALGLS
jgi:hypothetical protein